MINLNQTPGQIANKLVSIFEKYTDNRELVTVGHGITNALIREQEIRFFNKYKAALQAVELMLEVCDKKHITLQTAKAILEIANINDHKHKTLLEVQTILKNKLK